MRPRGEARLTHRLAIVVTGAVLVACSSPVASGDRPDQARPAEAISPAETGPVDEVVPQAPLVLAIHPTRPPLDVSSAVAADLIAGRVHDWAQLGAPAGPVRVVAGPNVAAAVPKLADDRAALAAVEAAAGTLALVPAGAVGPTVKAISVDGQHPLRAPGRYPLLTPGVRPAGAPVTITVVGDLMLGRRVARRNAGDLGAPLRPTSDRLAAADVTVGNFESTLSRAGPPRQGNDSFAADPRVLDSLRTAGFDVLDLANNHAGDFGDRALVETVRRIRAAGIQPVGAGADLTAARQPAIVQRAGLRIGFLAFNAIGETPRAGPDQPGAVSIRMQPRTGPLNAADLDAFLTDVAALRREVDVLIVLPHWGRQYTNQPVADQRRVAHALVEGGADLVIGGHPHWVQGLEMYRDRLIAYSLGNFIFDMDFMEQTMEGAFLEIVAWGDQVRTVDLVPYRMGRDFTPRVVPWSDADSILDLVWEASGPPFQP